MPHLSPRRRRRVFRPFAPSAEALEARKLFSVELLRDINMADRYPAEITQAGAYTYFVGHDTAAGYALYRTDGTPAGTRLLEDDPGPTPPDSLADVGGTLYFTGPSGVGDGDRLAKVDPVTGEVVTVAALDPAHGLGSVAFGLTAMSHGRLAFETVNDDSSRNVVVSDGTDAGTVAVLRNLPYSDGDAIAPLGDGLLFAAGDGSGGVALWKTDGTASGTARFADLPGGGVFARATLGGRVVFEMYDKDGSIWSTDGTPGGTVRLASAGFDGMFVVAGPTAYLYALDKASVTATDGTAAGTRTIDLGGGVVDATSDGTRVYFIADDPALPGVTDVWASDRSAGGAKRLAAVVAGLPPFQYDFPNAPGRPPGLVGLGGFAYLSAWDADHGLELWRVGDAGAALVDDLLPGPDGSDPGHLTAAGGRVAFSAHDPGGADVLYLTDGTAAGTARIVALPAPQNFGSVNLTSPLLGAPSVTVGPTTYFQATDAGARNLDDLPAVGPSAALAALGKLGVIRGASVPRRPAPAESFAPSARAALPPVALVPFAPEDLALALKAPRRGLASPRPGSP